jgi:hypothetical protein
LRKAMMAMFASISLMAVAFYLARADYDHVYSLDDAAHYRLMSEIGMFLLLIAFLLFLGASVDISRKLSPVNTVLAGALALGGAALIWGVVQSVGLNVHSWTILLLVAPLTVALSSFVLVLVGAIRYLNQKIHPETD